MQVFLKGLIQSVRDLASLYLLQAEVLICFPLS